MLALCVVKLSLSLTTYLHTSLSLNARQTISQSTSPSADTKFGLELSNLQLATSPSTNPVVCIQV